MIVEVFVTQRRPHHPLQQQFSDAELELMGISMIGEDQPGYAGRSPGLIADVAGVVER